MKDFWQAFLPMFVSMDPVGLIPFFVAFTSGTDRSETAARHHSFGPRPR